MRILTYFLSFILLCVIAVVGFGTYLFTSIDTDGYTFKEYKPSLSTQIFDKNGKLVANIFDEEHRFYVKYEDLPSRLIEALLAIEDTSFFEHNGVNIDAIFRALIKIVKSGGRTMEGASTLTQQFIKNTELTPEKTINRKLKEALLAYKMEFTLNKEEILERYLNYIFFGHGYYGVKTAALGYFRKDLNELSLKEIAILVGLPKAPSSYDPTKHLELSISRANNVVQRMYNLGWISKSEYENSISEIPIVFNDTLTQNTAPYVVDEVIKELSPKLQDLKSGGYQIHLNIDLDVQEMAQNALRFGYDEIVKRDKDANLSTLNGAMVVVNHQNGEVLALVGGVDYEKSNYNRATQSTRQPGSSFKPFLYQIAVDLGYSTMSEVADISRIFEGGAGDNKDWIPKNYGKDVGGFITLKQALTSSRNLATINLALDIGIDVVHSKLVNMGFENVPADLSIVLGSFGISPLEFSKFYTMFGNYGKIVQPNIIKNVIDQNGKTILEYNTNSYKASEEEQAFLVLDMMRNVVENGTGRNARVGGIEIAGKTGTTNKSVDAWFCGITPEIEALIWYGNDDNKPMRYTEGGARTSAPVFREFLSTYLKKFPNAKRHFSTPKGVRMGTFNGKTEYYTSKSPFPKQNPTLNEEILF
ncbi:MULTISPECIES: penicillin-binding protein 1A [unclassified Campylobacter]|uniref:penicillin-binding protein 1A n=1 Tax=unclassified Campylobacter TaxID=2593542 RepID=UPI001237ADE3|nr:MULTISPECIES: penicillin-binding protein 1A [unclassified Campylobacter]KAA6228432.1 penicillin-binding protein 1A [Campylobacter sp. LR185c]KAA6228919.1 penicillin-binding protein 1A [Campylobacter sp. LR196d]KAA6229405.1 penicillin-binding protein 1A [Campylobacter sp. LR286c]KAA6229870.1 penicillin-binding protein 1A [Campylobacter sp. LR264d]KAA6234083.1 penicillin-binding protein 1A [Campylobacter sp. LR291e]